MLFTILGWILFGLIAGFIARAIVPGKDDIGIWRTIVLGVVGSFVGGLIFGLLTGGLRGFEPSGWIGSIIGAVIVLVIYNKVTGRKRIGRGSSTGDRLHVARDPAVAHALGPQLGGGDVLVHLGIHPGDGVALQLGLGVRERVGGHAVRELGRGGVRRRLQVGGRHHAVDEAQRRGVGGAHRLG